MKNCPNCHAEIEDNARFCVFCMSSLQEKEIITHKKETNKRWLYIAAVCLLVVLILLFIILLLNGKFKKDNGNNNSSNTALSSTVSDGGGNNSSPQNNGDGSSSNVDNSGENSTPDTDTDSDTDTDTDSDSDSDTDSDGDTNNSSPVTPSVPVVPNNTPTTTPGNEQNPTVPPQNPGADNDTDDTNDKTNNNNDNDNDNDNGDGDTADDDTDNGQPPSQNTTPTYTYRDALYTECYMYGNQPQNQYMENHVVITGVSGVASDGIYEIPETIDGKKVVAVMQSAFSNPDVSANVKKIILPATMRSVWENAFSECYNLTDIYFRSKSISVSAQAFADVSKRASTFTIHCSSDCKDARYYYYRTVATKNYNANYQEWDGGEIK